MVDRNIDILEPRALEQINRRSNNWIQTEHLPHQPAIQCSSIGVSGYSITAIEVEVVCKLSRPFNALPLLVEVVVQVRCLEVWLVRDVVDGCNAQPVHA